MRNLLNCFAVAFLLVCSSVVSFVDGQCPQFAQLIADGDFFLRKGTLDRAVDKYEAAMIECPTSSKIASERLEVINDRCNTFRKECEQLEDSIRNLVVLFEMNEGAIDSLRSLSHSLQIRLDESRAHIAKSEARLESLKRNIVRVRDSMAVAGRRITLACRYVDDKPEYYYIDSNGEPIERLKTWTNAKPFQEDGYAEVARGGKRYLMDTTGKKEQFSRGLSKFSDQAINCSEENRRFLSEKVYYTWRLSILIANGNRIRNIPDRIDMLPILSYVNLSDNRLGNFRNLTQSCLLKVLNLHGNHIQKIPRKIGRLKKLEVLDLSNNDLHGLDTTLFCLSNLQVLNLSHNQISIVKDGIGSLNNLERLDLSFNNLDDLPFNFLELQNLRHLGLSGNRFELSPKLMLILQNLKNLETLRIGRNPCTDSDSERKKTQEILSAIMPHCIILFN